MKNLVLNFILLFAPLFCFSQNGNEGSVNVTANSYDAKNLEYIIKNNKNINNRFSKQGNLVGSLYINKKFSLAKVADINNYLLLRYDAYSDEMELKIHENKINYMLKPLGMSIIFKNNQKMYKVYDYLNKTNRETVKGFFIVLVQGDEISLLAQEKIKFHEEKLAQSGYDKYIPPTFKRTPDTFYIGFKNHTTKLVPKKKKEFISLFSTKKKKIEKFIKSGKLNIKKKNDLIKIFKYYNTI